VATAAARDARGRPGVWCLLAALSFLRSRPPPLLGCHRRLDDRLVHDNTDGPSGAHPHQRVEGKGNIESEPTDLRRDGFAKVPGG